MKTNNQSHSEFSVLAYSSCYISLMLLLGLTVLAAGHPWGKWALTIALSIASLKALIIILIFMHAGKNKSFSFIIGGFILFGLAVLLLVLSDFTMRIG